MKRELPDALAAAREEADRIRRLDHDPYEHQVASVDEEVPWADLKGLVADCVAFHAERMEKIPSATKYPESPAWIEYVRTVERELQRLLNLTPRQMAIRASWGDFLTFRGYATVPVRPRTVEKCRVLYLPVTDRGRMHVKNVDDILRPGWKPNRARPATLPRGEELVWDGTGSGMHIDDEPDEIFPLPVRSMYAYYADDVPGVVDFLTRYSPFHGGYNVVLHDKNGRATAIEKCSRNFIEVFPPDTLGGFTHCSGMVCRDPQSPLGRYQRQKRAEYRRRFDLPDDGPDQVFWDACDRAERMLVERVRAMGPVPRAEDVFRLFLAPWPDGLNKTGVKLHPEQVHKEYTWTTHGTLIDEKAYYRWERDEQLQMPEQPLVFQY